VGHHRWKVKFLGDSRCGEPWERRLLFWPFCGWRVGRRIPGISGWPGPVGVEFHAVNEFIAGQDTAVTIHRDAKWRGRARRASSDHAPPPTESRKSSAHNIAKSVRASLTMYQKPWPA